MKTWTHLDCGHKLLCLYLCCLVIEDVVTNLHGMIKVNIAIFLEVEFLSRYATESYDQTVHGHHRLNGDVGPDMLEIAGQLGQHGVWPGNGS